ncbi:glycosyl hydrolase family 8 [Anaeromicropila populeti]|nr:glycosyl hydrolase family 8 [Anaeromicropila populeti]
MLESFYTQWKNRYVREVKGNHFLQEYIYYSYDQPDFWPAITCSEAMGYGMVIFSIMSRFDKEAKKHFVKLYHYVKSYPSCFNNNLMAWQQIQMPDGTIKNVSIETSSATDGDMDICYGLFLADKLWGSHDGIRFGDEAFRRMNALMDSCVNNQYNMLFLGDWVPWDKTSNFQYVTRCSDFMLYVIRNFIYYDRANRWKWESLYHSLAEIINDQLSGCSKNIGLMPDFLLKVNGKSVPAPFQVLESKHDGDYYYNSCRVPWRYAMDSILNHTEPEKQLKIMNSFIRTSTGDNPDSIMSGYYVANGIPGLAFGEADNLAFIAPFLVSSLAESGNEDWTLRLWEKIMSKSIEQCCFYENTLKLLAMIAATGNWLDPMHL